MKVIVTGDKEYVDPEPEGPTYPFIAAKLDALTSKAKEVVVVCAGPIRGVEKLAAWWAYKHGYLQVNFYPDEGKGLQANEKRDKDMFEFGQALIVFCGAKPSARTKECLALAKKHNIPSRICTLPGK